MAYVTLDDNTCGCLLIPGTGGDGWAGGHPAVRRIIPRQDLAAEPETEPRPAPRRSSKIRH